MRRLLVSAIAALAAAEARSQPPRSAQRRVRPSAVELLPNKGGSAVPPSDRVQETGVGRLPGPAAGAPEIGDYRDGPPIEGDKGYRVEQATRTTRGSVITPEGSA